MNKIEQPPVSAQKWYKHKGLIVIGILAIITVLMSWIYIKVNQPKTAKLASTTITGVIISNYQGCSYDDGCILIVQITTGQKIKAVYGEGLTSNGACHLSSGFGLVPGDKVELHGDFIDPNTFSLCGQGAY